MCNLNETNPFVYNCFKKGGFTVSLSGNVHSQISTNQSIETTINLFSKKTGGLSGITEDEGVSEQWISKKSIHFCASTASRRNAQ